MYEDSSWLRDRVDNFNTRLNAHREAAKAQAAKEQVAKAQAAKGHVVSSREFRYVDVTLQLEEDHGEGKGPEQATSPDTTRLSPLPPVEAHTHRWLRSTSRFSQAMQLFWESNLAAFLRKQQSRSTLQGLENEVVVALIDDGVKLSDSNNPGQILPGKSFDFHDNTHGP